MTISEIAWFIAGMWVNSCVIGVWMLILALRRK
ncbi:hypothetical protein UFOVP728_15 [uncultured Caudovirales phage]|uniref:Uncharacterized protein n=1 Tax=uncultured Caudovirales phage TaxID=2100421 RepID=A0A6J5NPZ5_9CAUD|nr:hypothetical protein UFOVP728_15 [uncultured Caudovirales phage]